MTSSAVHDPVVVFSTIWSALLSVISSSEAERYCLICSVTSTCSFTEGTFLMRHSDGIAARIASRFLVAASCQDVVMVVNTTFVKFRRER